MSAVQTRTSPHPRWLLYACRTPYAEEVAEIVWRAGGEIAVLVDNLPDGPQASSLGRVIEPRELGDDERGLPTAIPLLTPGHRSSVALEARAAGIQSFPALLDPTGVVARTASIAQGVVVNALAVIAAGARVGAFVHVNRSASVGHHADRRDFVSLGPGCVLAGHVTIESGAFIGAGAVIGPKVRIGANAIVGAGAVVVHDVPAFATVVGNPAKLLRQADVGYGGALVPLATTGSSAGREP
jgi:sugar O-acyltransferase (sialic acid O-acetyltransferase NeuD family)